jgi:hypothetical protein
LGRHTEKGERRLAFFVSLTHPQSLPLPTEPREREGAKGKGEEKQPAGRTPGGSISEREKKG